MKTGKARRGDSTVRSATQGHHDYCAGHYRATSNLWPTCYHSCAQRNYRSSHVTVISAFAGASVVCVCFKGLLLYASAQTYEPCSRARKVIYNAAPSLCKQKLELPPLLPHLKAVGVASLTGSHPETLIYPPVIAHHISLLWASVVE